jgi:hypothetical protein
MTSTLLPVNSIFAAITASFAILAQLLVVSANSATPVPKSRISRTFDSLHPATQNDDELAAEKPVCAQFE